MAISNKKQKFVNSVDQLPNQKNNDIFSNNINQQYASFYQNNQSMVIP